MTLLTRRWSPMSRLGSIEPVGILNACTTYVRMKRARITATTTDSRYSRATDFLKVAEGSARDTVWDWAAAIGGYSSRSGRSWPSVDPQHGQECLLRNVHLPHALHALLAFLLLLEQLALARDVAAVALGDHVLPQGLDGLAGDDPAADGGLDRHLEHLARDELAHLFYEA